MLGTTIAACPGHDRISQRDDYRIADKRDVPSQPIPQATRSSEFIWDRSLSRDTLDHQASDRVSPQHADDAEPAVLQGVQRDGFVRPRDRRMSPGIAIKGARLASPGIEDGHVEHQIQFIRAVQDELACRPQTDAPCRLLDRGLAEMLQGTAEMLVGDGAKMAVAVERFRVDPSTARTSRPCQRRTGA